MDDLSQWQARLPPFCALLGIRLSSVTPERVTAEMDVREELCTAGAIAHGGALMAFADTLGALATIVNLPAGMTTATLESKTNFFAPAPVGAIVHGECVPLHRGRRTMTWQTRLTSAEGRLLALVTQTQIVLEPRG
ncbi:MAG: PaaI family thioesterase [Thermomicrobiales bacterium]